METVAVIFGGRSAEHDVSIITALASIIRPLELTRKYKIEAIYIAKDGSWYCDERLKKIDIFTSGDIDKFISKNHPVAIKFDNGLKIVKNARKTMSKTTIDIDIVFPAMHGTFGEDGALMGLLDMSGIAYVGCGLGASTIAMDKVLSKEVAVANNIPVTKFEVSSKEDIETNIDQVIKRIKNNLSFPLFIKPAHLGSSIGITRSDNDLTLRNGLEVAAHYDDKVIIEEEVKNLVEVTLPIIGNRKLTPALLEQPITRSADFFDFDTKYLQGGKKGKGSGNKGSQGYSKIPADLPKTLYDKAETLGLKIYKTVGCSGTARIDMLINIKSGIVYFNEINPMPGGLYAHNWRAAGLSSTELVEKLIDLAKDRYKEREQLATSFTTNYLQQF